jgi:hypothetical protein
MYERTDEPYRNDDCLVDPWGMLTVIELGGEPGAHRDESII